MIVTGYSSGMVECRWHDGYSIKREAFREDELQPGTGSTNGTRLNHITPGFAGRFISGFGYRAVIRSVCAARYLCCKTNFLQWLHKRSNPGRIVNLCFLIVLVFSTLLTA